MKKLIAFILIIALISSVLISCGDSGATDNTDNKTESNNTSAENNTASGEENNTENSADNDISNTENNNNKGNDNPDKTDNNINNNADNNTTTTKEKQEIKEEDITDINTAANVSVLKCNMGRNLSDSDLKDIEALCREKVGDKFISAEKRPGVEPALGFPTNADGEEIKAEIGDGITVYFLLLNEDEKNDVLSVIAVKYEFDFSKGSDYQKAVYQITFADIYRADLK